MEYIFCMVTKKMLCCKNATTNKDGDDISEGEWVDHFPPKKKKRKHQNKKSCISRSTSVDYGGIMKEKPRSVTWDDMIQNMEGLDKDDLDNPKYDEQVVASVANNTGVVENEMERMSMGSSFSDDTVSKSLGGFSSIRRRDSGFSSLSSAEGSVDEEQMV